MEHVTETLGFDPDEAAQTLGLSERQKLFALALVRGSNLTQAARAANYSGDGAALRSIASRAAKSPKVQAFREWAENSGAGYDRPPGDIEELRRVLWKAIRGPDKAASLRATEIATRIAALDADRPKVPRNPAEILRDISRFGGALADAIASRYGIPLPDDLRADADAQRAEIATGWIKQNADTAAGLAAEARRQTVVMGANGTATPHPAGPGGARLDQE